MKTVVHREKQGIKAVFSPNFGPHGRVLEFALLRLDCSFFFIKTKQDLANLLN
jgi:hypothetical protein